MLFYNFWNVYRKLLFAITLVFFKNFRLQAYTQMVSSAVMAGYILSYWPCARYVDNVSKMVNELTFMAMLVNCAYIKEMSGSVNQYSPSSSPAATGSISGGLMISMMASNLVFHTARMTHNSVQAAKTIKNRRQHIASKWMGPPTSLDPAYSPDVSSGSDSSSEEDLNNPDDCPNLKKLQPPKSKEPHLFNDLEALCAALSWPVSVSDKVPMIKKIMEPVNVGAAPPDSESEDIIVKILDIELEIPKLLGELEEPEELIVGEDIWPNELKDFMADQPGKDNELTVEIPALPEHVPGEPTIGQD